MADPTNQPILLKKVYKQEGAAHGGAWKVAYADFVTAMMAFFLLLWLLNVTTSDQKKGLSDYFAPASISKSQSGAGGMLGGQTIIVDGSRISSTGAVAVKEGMAPPEGDPKGKDKKDQAGAGKGEGGQPAASTGKASGQAAGTAGSEAGGQARDGQGAAGNSAYGDAQGRIGDTGDEQGKAGTAGEDAGAKPAEMSEEEFQKMAAEREERQMEAVETQLRQAIQDNPQIAELSKQIITDITPEGLRIQLVDQDRSSMFNSGSASMGENARKLMALVAQAVAKLPNKVSVSGHTDSTPFRTNSNYGNWELSADRANASRRALVEAGLPGTQIKQVVGRGDNDPLITSDPQNSANRRISIVLLRENLAK